jgi:hypothetical protein
MGNYAALFQQAQRTIAQLAGVPITYCRDNSSLVIMAVPAISNSDAAGQDVITEYRTRDYLVAASDLVIDGIAFTPQRGDTISETVGDEIHSYQVQRSDGGNEQPWRYTDTGRSAIRVHTMLMGITL